MSERIVIGLWWLFCSPVVRAGRSGGLCAQARLSTSPSSAVARLRCGTAVATPGTWGALVVPPTQTHTHTQQRHNTRHNTKTQQKNKDTTKKQGHNTNTNTKTQRHKNTKTPKQRRKSKNRILTADSVEMTASGKIPHWLMVQSHHDVDASLNRNNRGAVTVNSATHSLELTLGGICGSILVCRSILRLCISCWSWLTTRIHRPDTFQNGSKQ